MMSFSEKLPQYEIFNYDNFFNHLQNEDIIRAINRDKLSELDFLTLLSEKAAFFLEEMARKARQVTIQNFGRVILLYTPLYLSNHCDNHCIYCTFNTKNSIARRKLTPQMVEDEGRAIAEMGLRHILLLTGDSRQKSPFSYIKDSLNILKKHFSSLGIEVYPLKEGEYRELVDTGLDSLTIYQETYDREIYDDLHIKGPKKDYLFRLDAPERACRAGMRAVNIGPLLGLAPWRNDAFLAGLHASYLQCKYLDVEISMSLPRLQPFAGSFESSHIVSDRELVQMILALRLFMPRAGITVSTRERAYLRDNLVGLGVTKMSAASSTVVGGHTHFEGEGQFEISDKRSVKQIKEMLLSKGYQPVMKDWQPLAG